MLLLCALGALIALQFTDLLSTYAAYNTAITEASGLLQWLAGKIGLATTLITTKVVIIAIFVALYLFTKLPWWVYALVAAYYLLKTGRALVLWRKFVAAAEADVTKVVTKVDPAA